MMTQQLRMALRLRMARPMVAQQRRRALRLCQAASLAGDAAGTCQIAARSWQIVAAKVVSCTGHPQSVKMCTASHATASMRRSAGIHGGPAVTLGVGGSARRCVHLGCVL
jgi:hypothetical protein